MKRGLRALFAVVTAALTVALAAVPWPLHASGTWTPLVALVVFVAYSAYVWFAHDDRAGPGVPLWEMVLLGGACGACIGLLLGQTFLAGVAGLLAGLMLGMFADKWTGFVKHL